MVLELTVVAVVVLGGLPVLMSTKTWLPQLVQEPIVCIQVVQAFPLQFALFEQKVTETLVVETTLTSSHDHWMLGSATRSLYELHPNAIGKKSGEGLPVGQG